MKKSKVKYDKIVDYEIIKENYNKICKNTQNKIKLAKYDLFKSVNLNSIYNDLKNRKYKHGKYNIFLVHEPKYRIVMSENLRDKVVNHLVSNVFLKGAIYPKLIEENVATRIGKGSSAAIKLCKKYFNRMNNKYDNFYILKFDIKKYFYNIDHQILKNKLKDIFIDKEILNILYEIIDSTDYEYINVDIIKTIDKEIDKIKKTSIMNTKEKISELKKIPLYNKGKGIGIGSLTNQIFAVFYLDSIDHYIKESLGIKEYIRFMDDGVIFCEDKNKLQRIKVEVEKKINELGLSLNKKTKIYTAKEGIEFIGYRFISKNKRLIVKVRNSTKNRMKRKFLVLPRYNLEKYERVKASYKGILNYCSSKSLYNKYYKE